MTASLMNLPEAYARLVEMIVDRTGASHDLLHVHAGVALLLVASILTRRSLATPIPFLCVCAVELANEVVDRMMHGSWRVRDTGMDILNTLFWPAVLMLFMRYGLPTRSNAPDNPIRWRRLP